MKLFKTSNTDVVNAAKIISVSIFLAWVGTRNSRLHEIARHAAPIIPSFRTTDHLISPRNQISHLSAGAFPYYVIRSPVVLPGSAAGAWTCLYFFNYLPHRLTLIARSTLWLRAVACHFNWTSTAHPPAHLPTISPPYQHACSLTHSIFR